MTQPEAEDAHGILQKWKIKAEKAMFALKTTTEKDYFHKVKSLCREIFELDPEAPAGDTRIKRIIIHNLKPEFRSFVAVIQEWQIQLLFVEFKNLLAGQEALAKQMGRVSLKKKKEIVDSKCSNHITGDKEKLQHLSEYKGSKVVVTTNNSKLSIAYIGNTVVSPQHSDIEVTLQNVYHVPSMKKNLLSVAQLTSSGYFVLFGPQDVMVYRDLETIEEPVMKGQRLESVYVMPVEAAHIDKMKRNKTADMWHMWLGQVSYSKLEVIMKRLMLKGLP
ncbi:hypothetical protein CQW23_17365 [Capsicum baccatum]|uniref:Retrovirus-related Pol polyprotein from transposon TNT 1-94-like beta-barrel domain-containing protein n=1 Tax=Capsicum baccatum TaxID=33114 RepID=A0A2G2WDZ9_CAPBA|nr:hypothetical protein CQW23_17365 [Capsicum baccatum]